MQRDLSKNTIEEFKWNTEKHSNNPKEHKAVGKKDEKRIRNGKQQ